MTTVPELQSHHVRRRIAVVDDDPLFLSLMRELLTSQGYEVHPFVAGSTAYLQLRALLPDLLVLDLLLEHPETGWWVLDLVRLDPALRAMPVIICSAAVHELRARAAEFQSRGCWVLAKPFDLGVLLTLLQEILVHEPALKESQ